MRLELLSIQDEWTAAMKIKVTCLSADKGLEHYLQSPDEFELSIGLPQEARALLNCSQPDVIVLDIRGHHEALALVEAVRGWQPGGRTLLLVDDKEDEQVLLRFLFAGAMGYIHQSHIASRLRAAVLAVQQDQAWVPREVVAHFIDTLTALKQNNVIG